MNQKIQKPKKLRSLLQLINLCLQPLYLYIMYSVNSSSFPFVALKKNVRTDIVGLVFSAWSFPSFIIPFMLPQLLARCGKRRTFIQSLLIAIVLMGSTGLLPLFKKLPFSIVSTTLRILQGAVAAVMNPMYFSLSAQLFPETKDTIYAYQVLGIVGGIGLGPFIGAPLYKALGFSAVQFIIALTGLIIFLPLAVYGIPIQVDHIKKEQLNDEQQEEDSKPLLRQIKEGSQFYCVQQDIYLENTASKSIINNDSNYDQKKYEISCENLSKNYNQSAIIQMPQDQAGKYQSVKPQNFFYSKLTFAYSFKKARVIAGILVSILAVLPTVYYLPYLSLYLKHRYDIKQQSQGFYYGVRSISSAIGAIISPIVARKLGLSNFLWLFSLIMIIAIALSSQSWAFAMPQYIEFVVVGFILMGFSCTINSVQIVPYLTDFFIQDYKQRIKKFRNQDNKEEEQEEDEDEEEINVPYEYVQRSVQIASSLYVFSYGVCEVVGPLMGGSLYQLIGYRKAGDAENLLIFIFFIYFSIFGGVKWFDCRRKSKN